MYQLRSWLADRILALSLWIRPQDCIAGTGWASASEYSRMAASEPPAEDAILSLPLVNRLWASLKAVKAREDDAVLRTYDSVLRGLRSENDSPQLRAIIASVEADRALATSEPPREEGKDA